MRAVRYLVVVGILALVWGFWLSHEPPESPQPVATSIDARPTADSAATAAVSPIPEPAAPQGEPATLPDGLHLLQVLDTPPRAVLGIEETALTVGVEEETPWGLVVSVAARPQPQVTLRTAGGDVTLTAPVPPESAPQPTPTALVDVAYQGFHAHLESAILDGLDGFGFVTLEDALLVDEDSLTYAGLQVGDVIRGVNLISVREMREIGELGSILAGGRLDLDVLRNGAPVSIVIEWQF